MILDVGCGSKPQGDVNVDLLIKNSDRGTCKEINVLDAKNLVNADIRFLPFVDKCFDKTVSFHLLEHVRQQRMAIMELLRVTKGNIELRVPFKWWEILATNMNIGSDWRRWRHIHHIYEYTRNSLLKLLCSIFTEDRVRVTYCHISLPHIFIGKAKRNPKIPFMVPYELKAVITLVKGGD